VPIPLQKCLLKTLRARAMPGAVHRREALVPQGFHLVMRLLVDLQCDPQNWLRQPAMTTAVEQVFRIGRGGGYGA
jgi:hypothetical protein